MFLIIKKFWITFTAIIGIIDFHFWRTDSRTKSRKVERSLSSRFSNEAQGDESSIVKYSLVFRTRKEGVLVGERQLDKKHNQLLQRDEEVLSNYWK